MLGTCEMCGEDVAIAGVGRSRRFCSNACRQKAYRQRSLPREMTERDRWTRWTLAIRRGRYTKLPLTLDGKLAASTLPTTWAPYEQVKASKVGNGLGYMLGDGIGCIDLDDCLDMKGRPNELAREILAALPPTFIEISQSGRGLHIFGLLPEAPGHCRDGVEVYSSRRFIAMTGRRWKRSPAKLADLSAIRSVLT